MSEAPESKKRSKKRYGGNRSKRARGRGWGSRELEVGMQGVLITCNMNERKCTAEAFNLLTEYADKLYGPETLQGGADSGSEEEEGEEEEEDDVEVALRKEVCQLRASSRKRQRRFQALDSGANNVIFIRTTDLEPDKLVYDILSDLHTTKKKKSRVILRMLPVSGTCKAFQEDMERYLTTFLEPWFKAPSQASYQIAFKARNSSHNKRDNIIKALAGVVGKLNPKNKVDLSSPELTVIVEVIRSVCCLSVVRHYALYRKYNLQEVVREDAAKQGGDAAKQGGDAAKQGGDAAKQGGDAAKQGGDAAKQGGDAAKQGGDAAKQGGDAAAHREEEEEEEEVKTSDREEEGGKEVTETEDVGVRDGGEGDEEEEEEEEK